jgi:hypothetical protein
MKRTVFSVTAGMVLAGSFVIAQSQTPQTPRETPQPAPSAPSATQPSSQDRSGSETRLTGCLIQGSSPNVFVLDNARMSTDAKTAEGKKYVVVMADASGLRSQLNRQVTITGTADDKAGAAMSPSATSPSSSQTSPSSSQTSRPGQSGQAGQAGQAARESDSDRPGQAAQAGQAAAKTTSAQERDFPRLTAKTIVRIADVCTTTE